MKQINEKLLKLNEELAHGAKKEIADRCGIAPQTVYRFFKGYSVRPSTQKNIIKAVKNLQSEENKIFSAI